LTHLQLVFFQLLPCLTGEFPWRIAACCGWAWHAGPGGPGPGASAASGTEEQPVETTRCHPGRRSFSDWTCWGKWLDFSGTQFFQTNRDIPFGNV
jgi:hypothetical protein